MKNKLQPLSVYIHIPFCVRKCLYCDFLSGPAGRNEQEAYVQALQWEIQYEKINYQSYEVQTVFIGGGTPSVLPAQSIETILNTLRIHYHMAEDCEITIEVNPGSATKEKLASYSAMGINRLSIGLQSANDNELKKLGRIHNCKEFYQTYQDAVKSGFNNINIDLMSAIPDQTVDSYLETLKYVTALRPTPQHISAYSLIIEEGTSFYENTPELPDEDTDRELYKITSDFLSKLGYHRYEISNYAKEGYECKHNLVYWNRGNYVGFGIGAASFIHNERYNNTTDRKNYVNQITFFQQKSISSIELKENIHTLSTEEQMDEFMFLGLRLMKGMNVTEFYKEFGKSFDQVHPGQVDYFCKEKLLERRTQSKSGDEVLVLTERGIDVSNVVMSELLLT